MKKYIISASLTLALTACGSTTVIKEVAPSTTVEPVKETVVVTVPVEVPAPAKTNKYDDYMDHVLNNSGQANSTWSKAQLIEFGDLVCGALDNGNSIRDVINLMNSYAVTSSDTELFVSVLVGAVMNLCPEYTYELESYVRS